MIFLEHEIQKIYVESEDSKVEDLITYLRVKALSLEQCLEKKKKKFKRDTKALRDVLKRKGAL